jgi:hypothetical protein
MEYSKIKDNPKLKRRLAEMYLAAAKDESHPYPKANEALGNLHKLLWHTSLESAFAIHNVCHDLYFGKTTLDEVL